MGVSVVIPTKNGERYIKDLLESLRAQTVKPEIIVIDSSSRDKTPEIAKRYADVFVSIREEEFNHGLTRNLGVEISKGDIVVFFSQDALPENDKTLEVLIKPIEEGKVVLSYARTYPLREQSPQRYSLDYFPIHPSRKLGARKIYRNTA